MTQKLTINFKSHKQKAKVVNNTQRERKTYKLKKERKEEKVHKKMKMIPLGMLPTTSLLPSPQLKRMAINKTKNDITTPVAIIKMN